MRALAEAGRDEAIVQAVLAQIKRCHSLAILENLTSRENRICYARFSGNRRERESRAPLTRDPRQFGSEVVQRASSSLSRLWRRFFRLPPWSTSWPRTYRFRNGTGGGKEELAKSSIHSAKVGWRCETVFSEERAPLGLFGSVS